MRWTPPAPTREPRTETNDVSEATGATPALEAEGAQVANEAGGSFAAQLLGQFVRYGSSILLTRALGLSWFGSFTLGG